LQRYDFEIRYKQGAENHVAVCLSRFVEEDDTLDKGTPIKDVRAAQHMAGVVNETFLHSYAAIPVLIPLTQIQIEEVPCSVCGHPARFENIVFVTGVIGVFICAVCSH
jgi:predicted lipase